MEVHMTAPHSPSQNGIAKCMNRTLEDLARAMRLAADLPVFLWEQAVAHAAYVHNRAYSSAVKTVTPYEHWHRCKPDVSHLQEFGAPVWVLLQGQKMQLKMEAKSKHRALVGYDDGSKSILFYNAETRKVLNSRNFHFLNPSSAASPEHLLIMPDIAEREGESMVDTLQHIADIDQAGPTNLQKRPADDVEENTRCTRKKRVDYRQLHDPFSDKETMHADKITNLLEGDVD